MAAQLAVSGLAQLPQLVGLSRRTGCVLRGASLPVLLFAGGCAQRRYRAPPHLLVSYQPLCAAGSRRSRSAAVHWSQLLLASLNSCCSQSLVLPRLCPLLGQACAPELPRLCPSLCRACAPHAAAPVPLTLPGLRSSLCHACTPHSAVPVLLPLPGLHSSRCRACAPHAAGLALLTLPRLRPSLQSRSMEEEQEFKEFAAQPGAMDRIFARIAPQVSCGDQRIEPPVGWALNCGHLCVGEALQRSPAGIMLPTLAGCSSSECCCSLLCLCPSSHSSAPPPDLWLPRY